MTITELFSIFKSNTRAACPELAPFNESNTDVLDKMMYTSAEIINNTLSEFDNTKTIINDSFQYGYGKSGWYIDLALAFQYGDSLVQGANYDYVYETVRAAGDAAFVIKQAAFELQTNAKLLKVASIDNSGNLIKVPDAEFAAFITYCNARMQVVGDPLTPVTYNPCIIKFTPTIIYDANYDLATLKTNVLAKANEFKNTFPFNGLFYKSGKEGFEDYIVNKVDGIKLCEITAIFMTDASDVTVPVVNRIALPSGYFNYHADVLTALNNSANYSL